MNLKHIIYNCLLFILLSVISIGRSIAVADPAPNLHGALEVVKRDLLSQNFLSAYVPCSNLKEYNCNDLLNGAPQFFSDPTEAIDALKAYHSKQDDQIVWVFSGRFYLKYEKSELKSLSEENLAAYVQPGIAPPVVRPEEMNRQPFSLTALGLNTLGDEVLSTLKMAYPNKKILVLFITESYIVSPDLSLDGQQMELTTSTLNRVQKDMFFRAYNLDQSAKQQLNATFHPEYIRQLDYLETPQDASKKNDWLRDTTKDLIAAVSNDQQHFSGIPVSTREKSYFYSLKNAGYKTSAVVGFDEFKPGGYRYNHNALYNYYKDMAEMGVDPTGSLIGEGVVCGPNLFYHGTTAIAGISSISNGSNCEAVTDQKLWMHFMERGKDKLPEQMARTIERAIELEIQLVRGKKPALAERVFLARRSLLTKIASYASLSEISDLYKWANTKITLDEQNPSYYSVQAYSGLSIVGTVSRSVTSAELARLAGLETGGTVGTAADAAAVGSRASGEVVSLRALRANIATAAVAVVVGSGIDIYNNQKALEATGLLFALYDTFDEVSLSLNLDDPFAYDLDPDLSQKTAKELEWEDYKRLKHLFDTDKESMDEEELNLYFWYLCHLDLDCRFFDPVKYEWHHVIPKETENHPLVIAAKQCAEKFYFNGQDNLMSLEKYVIETGKGRHGNHPKYNDWVEVLLNNGLDEFKEKNNRVPNPCEARELLLDLRNDILEIINLHKELTINELGKKYLGL